MSYEAFALISPHSSASLKEVESKLRSFYQNEQREVSFSYGKWPMSDTPYLKLVINGWNCKISFSTEDGVVEESQEMAEQYASNHPEKEIIASCISRFEITCDVDPDMVFFNDYVFVLNQLQTLPGVFVLDEASGDFI